MTHFVLVHGAWHGGWCWEQVADATARRGAVDAVPAAVIVCSRSSGIPFADWATAFGWPIRRLDAGHDAMVTDPAELARMLEDCARAPRP